MYFEIRCKLHLLLIYLTHRRGVAKSEARGTMPNSYAVYLYSRF